MLEPRNILLLGLADALASALRKALPEQGWTVWSEPCLPDSQARLTQQLAADLIFCAAERGCSKALLEQVKQQRPDLPVIVVSPCPEISDWLDAIEAGASDYCAPPFEPTHIHWVLQNALRSRSVAA